jgi:hypothetical protein
MAHPWPRRFQRQRDTVPLSQHYEIQKTTQWQLPYSAARLGERFAIATRIYLMREQ